MDPSLYLSSDPQFSPHASSPTSDPFDSAPSSPYFDGPSDIEISDNNNVFQPQPQPDPQLESQNPYQPTIHPLDEPSRDFSYSEMISAAIAALDEPEGSSKKAISRYIEENNTTCWLPVAHKLLLGHYLKIFTTIGLLVRVRKSYKLAVPFPPESVAVVASPASLQTPKSEILPIDDTVNEQGLLDLADASASFSASASEIPQKRGRGRPPKPKHGAQQPTAHANGLPSLEQNEMAVTNPTVTNPTEEVQVTVSARRGPGRPRKGGSAPISRAGVMKQRGRQRKPTPVSATAFVNPQVANSASMAETSDTVVAPTGVQVVAVARRIKHGRGRPPKIGGVLNRIITKPKRGRGRPGRPRKNTTLAVTGVSGPQDTGYEELKKKYDLYKEKALEIVNVLRAKIATNNPAVLVAITNLEELTGYGMVEPEVMEENTTLAVAGATGPQESGYEELKKKLDLYQEKALEIVSVLRAKIATNNPAVLVAMMNLEELSGYGMVEPEVMEEVQPDDVAPQTEAEPHTEDAPQTGAEAMQQSIQIAPPTKNGHAPPPIESRKSSQSVNPYYVWTCAGGTTRPVKARSVSPTEGTSRPELALKQTSRPIPSLQTTLSEILPTDDTVNEQGLLDLAAVSAAASSARGCGRPPNPEPESQQPIAHANGLPSLQQDQVTVTNPTVTIPTEEVQVTVSAKRGPGRPRKDGSAPISRARVSGVMKQRGRPRKSTPVSATAFVNPHVANSASMAEPSDTVVAPEGVEVAVAETGDTVVAPSRMEVAVAETSDTVVAPARLEVVVAETSDTIVVPARAEVAVAETSGTVVVAPARVEVAVAETSDTVVAPAGAEVVAVAPRIRRGRGRPPKIGGVVNRVIAKPKRGRGRPGRPRKNTTLAVTGAAVPQDTSYEELKKKFDLFQEKALEIVNVLRAEIETNDPAVLEAMVNLEKLTTVGTMEPEVMEEVQPEDVAPQAEAEPPTEAGEQTEMETQIQTGAEAMQEATF
ncbi:unnamed protein product [Microthlaspi erraticum]|uniref:H15 domain-containing protein n=1 Tax=Microthlaspi erraticum TaxID=1685480 RepID=A0A6D2KQN5_9BRAS|nr:unnamed protein product [Microthlaspi erraticum]